MVHHLPVVQTQRNTDTHTTDTDTETHTQRQTQTQTQTHAETHTQRQNRKHVYSRRWSWPSFHRGGSSDPALRRHARHCGTRPATSVLVSPQDVFGGTQTSTLSPPPLLPLSRSFSSSSPCSRLTFSQVTVLEVHKTCLQPHRKLIVKTQNLHLQPEINSPNIFLSVMISVSMARLFARQGLHSSTQPFGQTAGDRQSLRRCGSYPQTCPLDPEHVPIDYFQKIISGEWTKAPAPATSTSRWRIGSQQPSVQMLR